MGHPRLTHLPPLCPQLLPAVFAHLHPTLPVLERRQHFPPQPRPCPSRTPPPGQISPSCSARRAGMGVREQPGAGVSWGGLGQGPLGDHFGPRSLHGAAALGPRPARET